MKSYTVMFACMVESESLEDAVQETIGSIVHAMKHGTMIPLTVQEEDGAPVLVETLVSSDGTTAATPITEVKS